MGEIITVERAQRIFRVPVRGQGIQEAIKSLFNRKFKTITAVQDVTFSVQSGEILGLLGPNGAGKSTLIKMLTGILSASSGNIRVMGYDPFAQREQYVRHIGALFGQKTQLWWDIPAADTFELSRHLYDLDPEEFTARKNLLIDKLAVHEILHKPVRNLSLGERMKCEFIMVMLHNPPLVFLDEPTIGLDVIAKETIREFILYANTQLGTTFILTTHDMDDIEHLAERVIIINHGEKVFDGSIKKLHAIAGEKKYVRVVGREKLPSLKWKGITNVHYISEYEASFSLDRKKLRLDELTKRLAKSCGIQDLEVSDPSVEEIIKKVYSR